MSIQLSEQQSLALRKNAIPLLRTLGVRDAADYEPYRLGWKQLNAHASAVTKAAAGQIDQVSDDANDATVRSAEDCHDACITVLDAIETERSIRAELGDRGARKTPYGPKVPGLSASGEVRGDGEPIHSDDPTAAYALRSDQRMVEWAREFGGGDYGALSTGAYLRAMVTGPKTDIERRALSEGTDSAGGYTVPDILSSRVIDALRSASVVFQAGAQVVPLTSDTNSIAKVASDPVPAWRLENAAIAESDPTFTNVTLTPRSLAVLVKVSRELLEDSINMETTLPALLATSLGQELDRVALQGTGTAPQPRGVVNFSGLTSNTFAGGALTSYAPLITARTALRTANSKVTGYILSPRDEGTFAGLADTTGQPLELPPSVRSIPWHVTSAIPTNGGGGTESQIIAGDWSKLLVGIRSALRIEILREAFAGNHQYGFVCHMRADVVAEHEGAFTVLDAVTP